jgi:hypothetical protein
LGGVGLQKKKERLQFGMDEAMLGGRLQEVLGAGIGADDVQEERRGSALKETVRLSVDHHPGIGGHQLPERLQRRGLLGVREKLVGGTSPKSGCRHGYG